MIINADSIESGAIWRSDVCVVGAGPAGIVLALQLAASGLAVLLLESGGRRPDGASQTLCRGEVRDPGRHPPAHLFRRRCVGGSSTIWGGRCVPLDPVDFAPRPWLDLPSTWPMAYEAMLPYWRRAHAWADLGRYDYDATTAISGGMRPMFAGFASDAVSTDRIERFSKPTDFGATYASQLARDPNIQLLLHATCVNIALEPECAAVRQLDVRNRASLLFHVRARAYVLATGGLEAPRLLLASRGQSVNGIGNGNDLVGRHYMCHLAATLGAFMPSPGTAPWHGYERDDDSVYCRRRLSVEPWAQQARRIGNVVARLHHPPAADATHRSGPLSALHLGRRHLPIEYAMRFDAHSQGAATWRHMRNVAADPWNTAKFAALCLRQRVLAARKYPSMVVVPRRGGSFALDVHAEQLPNPNSRITLSRQSDPNGVPKLRVEWNCLKRDIDSVRIAMELFAAALAAGRHGALAFDPAAVEAHIVREGAYGGHHLGTTRMADSPRTGVVDGQCQVHGVRNLYIVGGAVFPTSGQANPTLTILALSLRLADCLADCLRGPRHAPQTVRREPETLDA